MLLHLCCRRQGGSHWNLTKSKQKIRAAFTKPQAGIRQILLAESGMQSPLPNPDAHAQNEGSERDVK